MPTQGGIDQKKLWKYGVNDTGPPLTKQLFDMDGFVIDLTLADKVLLSVGWRSYDHFFHPTQAIVDRGVGSVIDAFNGMVQYDWQPGDLRSVGQYDFSWEIVWLDGTVQTTLPLAYDYISVQAAPFAGRKAYTP